MTRRWLLLPLIAVLAAPLAWSAAAASFQVSPSVLATQVVTDPLPDPGPGEPAEVTISIRMVGFNPGDRNNATLSRTETIPAGTTYQLVWSNQARELNCADFTVPPRNPGPQADVVGFRVPVPATSNLAHDVCFRNGGSGAAGELQLQILSTPSNASPQPSSGVPGSSATTSGVGSSTSTSRSPAPSADPASPPPSPDSTTYRSQPPGSHGSGDGVDRVEPPSTTAPEDAFDLPPEERAEAFERHGSEQDEEVAP